MANSREYQRGMTNSASANVWSNVIGQGFRSADNTAKLKVQQQNNYMKALETAKAHEMQQEQHDFETANKLLTQISEKFPIGDQKAENEYMRFKMNSPEQYKALMQQIKKGAPWAVQDGEIMRMPAYDAAMKRLEYRKKALEENIASGNVSEQDAMEYTKTKVGAKLLNKAIQLASTDSNFNWDQRSEQERNSKVIELYNTLFGAAVKQTMAQGQVDVPPAPPAQPQRNALADFLGNIFSKASTPAQFQQVQPTQQGETPNPNTTLKVGNRRVQ